MSEQQEKKGDEGKSSRKLFSDISAVQVVATALASITSMLLASYIGIAGSVIGVGVASVVSTMAASLYKKFLADSAEKIKELPDAVKSVTHHGHAEPHAPEGKNTEANASHHSEEDAGAATKPLPTQHPQAHHKKRLIIVCVVSALIAVAVSAIIVYVATTGEGLGAKPEPIIQTQTEPVERATASAGSSAPSNSSEANAQNASTADQTNTANAQNSSTENTEATNTTDQRTDQTSQTNTQTENTSDQQTNQTDDPQPANTDDSQQQ